MLDPRTGFLLVTLALAAENAAAAPRYILVTRSGQRIEATAKPKTSGKNVTFFLTDGNVLTSLAAAEIDWDATEKLNAAPQAPAAPTPAPTAKPRLADLTAGLHVDSDKAEARQKAEGTMTKKGDDKVVSVTDGPFFGADSVAKYLEATRLASNLNGCPGQRALVYGSVRNISKLKLRNLKARVLIGDPYTGKKNEQIQTMDPENILPGEEAEIHLYISCGWVSHPEASGVYVFFLSDVSGKAEELAKPDGTNPFLPTPPVPKAAVGKQSKPGRD